MAEARRWRLWVRLPKQHFEYFEKYAAQLGIPMSQLIAMCAWSGARTVIPALDPPAYEALKAIEQEERERIQQEIADAYAESYFATTPEAEYLKEKEEDYKEWLQKRGLHNDE